MFILYFFLHRFKKKITTGLIVIFIIVETTGIEPVSEYKFLRASTCVGLFWFLTGS